jgi:hypothetical protein
MTDELMIPMQIEAWIEHCISLIEDINILL